MIELEGEQYTVQWVKNGPPSKYRISLVLRYYRILWRHVPNSLCPSSPHDLQERRDGYTKVNPIREDFFFPSTFSFFLYPQKITICNSTAREIWLKSPSINQLSQPSKFNSIIPTFPDSHHFLPFKLKHPDFSPLKM